MASAQEWQAARLEDEELRRKRLILEVADKLFKDQSTNPDLRIITPPLSPNGHQILGRLPGGLVNTVMCCNLAFNSLDPSMQSPLQW